MNSAAVSYDWGSGWALNLSALGLIEVRDGKPDAAIPVLDSVLKVTVEQNAPRGEARSRLHLGMAYRAKGDVRRASSELERTLEIARRTSQRLIALEALGELAELEEARGNDAAALLDLRQYQALRDTLFAQSTAQGIAVMESRIESERQQRENARLVAERREQETLILRQRIIVGLGAVVLLLGALVVMQLVRYNKRGREREALLAKVNTDLAKANADLAGANAELRTALSEVRTLKGLIPICANCKRIRDDKGFWEAVETYVGDRSHAMFSHGICTHCGPELYGDAWPTELTPAGEPVDERL